MKKNLGSVDRVIRMIFAVVLAVLYFSGSIVGPVGLVILALAAILAFTSVVGFCPLYRPFNLSTVKKKVETKNL
jgi:hypothetical protein